MPKPRVVASAGEKQSPGPVPPLLIVVAVAAAVRVAALGGDFWLDEVWSYNIARALGSPLEIVTGVHLDNNHYLNTFFLYALGDRWRWEVYRLPSLLAGVASVWLTWAVMRRHGRREGLLAALLFAGSFAMIQYSAEARGYAWAVLLALACYGAAHRLGETAGVRWMAAFAGLACIGLLTHLTFALALAALVPWVTQRLLRRRPRSRSLPVLVGAFAPPLALASWLWVVTVSRTLIGGGPDESLGPGLVFTLSYAAGGPSTGVLAAATCAATLATVIGGIYQVARKDRGEALFFVLALALPVAAFVWRRPDFVHPRYFLVGLAFATLAAAIGLGRLRQRSGAGRAVAAALLALTLTGNAYHLVDFLRVGRGDYLETLRQIVELSPGPRIAVGGDHKFRNLTMIRFYGRYVGLGQTKMIDYADLPQLGPEGAQWLLLHRFDDLPIVDEVRDPHGNRYRLVKRARFSGLSGWCWHLYARQP